MTVMQIVIGTIAKINSNYYLHLTVALLVASHYIMLLGNDSALTFMVAAFNET